MENINACIKYWLKYSGRFDEAAPTWEIFPYYGFINEYEQHYNKNSDSSGHIFTDDDLRAAALPPEGYFTDIEILTDRICLKLAVKYLHFVENLIMGYEIHKKDNEFIFDLCIDLNDGKNEILKISVNDIINDYIGEVRFTRGLIINNIYELKNVFRTMYAGCADLSVYIDELSCTEYFRFLTQTDFLDEYEKMNLNCQRSNEDKTVVDKKTVMNMLMQYGGTTVKHFARDRFFRVIKTVGDVQILYEATIRKNLLNLCLCGSRNGKRLFGSPSIESLIKDIKGVRLHSLEFQSIEELKCIFDFMQKYFDILASYFNESSDGNVSPSSRQ